ncbi:MAG: AI-2E family transporter [Nitriliruptorales bacterium]|nr:AI-2E family transporter [Nitriliruptorales bacterium]
MADSHEEPTGGRRGVWERPVVRAGLIAWAIAGVLVIGAIVGMVLARLTVVIVPLVVALFPAAVLVPPTTALRRRGVPGGLAALVVLLVSIGLLVGLFSILTPAVASELGGLVQSLEDGYTQVRGWLARGPLHVQTLPLDQMLSQLSEQAAEQGADLSGRILEAGAVVLEGVAGVALMLFTLFFYLKDGARIATWVRNLFPQRVRADVQGIGDRVWFTIGAYIRGLLVIGLADAFFIGIGLLVLRVPLALPLSVLVFFGALFPIVGAFTAGTVAVLVALATKGIAAALAVLVLIVVVQQLEGHILTPIMLGRATELHPLAVIVALTSGAVLFGIVGAFLSVPVAASMARALSYLRQRTATEPA